MLPILRTASWKGALWMASRSELSGRPAGARSNLPNAESSESPVEVMTGAFLEGSSDS